MYKYKTNISLLFLISVVLSLTIISCSDDSSTEPKDENNAVLDQALIGTWELTKITKPIVTTPDLIGLALTAVFTGDGNLQFTTTDTDTVTTDSGTWSTSGGVLTITIDGETPGVSPYTVVGNKATINDFPVEFQGTILLASLEFTKKS